MKTTTLSITVPQPCSQNWDDMKKQDKGRFCESCQKSVLDFTGLSNAEIIKLIINSNNDTCGRFTNRQLIHLKNYSLVVPSQRNWMKYIGVLAIGASIFTQGCDKIKTNVPIENIGGKNIMGKLEKIATINGYVVDDNNQPLSGVKVIIENTELFAITDHTGRYDLDLKEHLDSKNKVLKLYSMSFEGEIIIDYSRAAQNKLKAESMFITMGIILATPIEIKKE
jgi:hypothetical protein